MRTRLWWLLFTVVLAGTGVCPPVARAADDASKSGEELAATAAEEAGPPVARYLVTFLKSRTTDPLRSATVVSVTNQADRACQVSVEWVRGFEPPPACTTTVSLEAGITTDFCSRALPAPLTTCNATCDPELTFHEGRAVVSSSAEEGCERLGVSARVYYTTGDTDDTLAAISDSDIVLFGQGILNAELSGAPDPKTFSFDPAPVPEGPAGTFAFSSDFCNIGSRRLTELTSVTTTLTGGNVLLNRDDGTPPGVDSELTFPANGGYADRILEGDECVAVPYRIGLATDAAFEFIVDVVGRASEPEVESLATRSASGRKGHATSSLPIRLIRRGDWIALERFMR